jgi:hypothetical protein
VLPPGLRGETTSARTTWRRAGVKLHLIIEDSLAEWRRVLVPDEIAGQTSGMPDAEAVYSGTLIGESLRVGTELDGIPLTVTKFSRIRVEDEPQVWTLIYFDVAAARAADLAERLSRLLVRDGGWYCDFRSDDEVFVVFCDRVFRYRRGDGTARSAAEDYARSMGVPEAQIDWPG